MLLLSFERVCDAIAAGEVTALGLAEDSVVDELHHPLQKSSSSCRDVWSSATPNSLTPGEHLSTPPGRSHSAGAITDTRFVLVLPSIPVYG